MDNNNPFITIGIASYNYADYLDRAFDAIKRQSFRDFEVLYADDGSTDDSVTVINRIIADNPDMNIRLVAGENLGVMGNKQRILDNALGQYIMLCDADDWMDDNCLEILAERAFETDADRVVSEVRNVDSSGKTISVQRIPATPSKWCEVLHHGAIYKRRLIAENHIRFGNLIPDDFCFVADFNIYAQKTEFIHSAIYNWCRHEDSTSRNLSGSAWKGHRILNNVLIKAQQIKPKLQNTEDITLLQAECIKYYWYHMLVDSLGIKNKNEHYKKIHDLMLKYEPDFLSNPYMRLFHPGPFRRTLHIALSMLTVFERIKIIPLILRILGIAKS